MSDYQSRLKNRLDRLLVTHNKTIEELDSVTMTGKGITRAMKCNGLSFADAQRVARHLGIDIGEILEMPEPDENGDVILFKCRMRSE